VNIARAGSLADSPTALAGEEVGLLVRRAALWAMVVAKLVGGWGVQWDIQWHVRIGRDSFWIAPHVMTYAGVAGVVLLSFGVLAWDTWRRRAARLAPDEMTIMGLTGTPGFHLAAWGIALTVLAAPIDDLWHRMFGIDVTLWSPPHLLGMLGSLINSVACLLIAREVYPQGGGARAAALIVNAAMLLGGFATIAQPAFRLAYLHGGVSFHLWAMLGALCFPLAYVTAARLTGSRWAPILVFGVSVLTAMVGVQIARVGFDILRPESVIEAEIAKDPQSPIAVAHAIAVKNRQSPGTQRLATQWTTLIPVLVMVTLDPRRRPGLSTLAYGVALLATMGSVLATSPAFAPMVPGLGATVIALGLTIVAAVGGVLGVRALSVVLGGTPTGAR
jgi:hypothetical protein